MPPSSTKWLSTSEAADLMDVSPSTIRRLIDGEELDARRKTKSGPYLVSRDSVEEYLDDIETGKREHPEVADAYKSGFDAGYDEAMADLDSDSDADEDDDEADLDDEDEEDA